MPKSNRAFCAVKDAVPHFPGDKVNQQYGPYSPYQETLWNAYDDIYHGRVFGFAHTRKPDPRTRIDQRRYEGWENKFLSQSIVEAHRDNGTRGLTKNDHSQSEMLYLYERMVEADKYTTKPQIIMDD